MAALAWFHVLRYKSPPCEVHVASQESLAQGHVPNMAAVARRYINMWTFLSLHPANIELLQRLKSARRPAVWPQMDICGEVPEQDPRTAPWADTHIVGMRTDIWNPGIGANSHQSSRAAESPPKSTPSQLGRQAA